MDILGITHELQRTAAAAEPVLLENGSCSCTLVLCATRIAVLACDEHQSSFVKLFYDNLEGAGVASLEHLQVDASEERVASWRALLQRLDALAAADAHGAESAHH